MLLSKFTTQKMIDTGKHKPLVIISLIILMGTMASYYILSSAVHLLTAGFLLGIGIGSLLMGFFQDSIGLSAGFAITSGAYMIGGIIYLCFIDKYYHRLLNG